MTATLQPWVIYARAMARPIPVVPPVMAAVLWARRCQLGGDIMGEECEICRFGLGCRFLEARLGFVILKEGKERGNKVGFKRDSQADYDEITTNWALSMLYNIRSIDQTIWRSYRGSFGVVRPSILLSSYHSLVF